MATQKRPKDEIQVSAPLADETFLIDGPTRGVRALQSSYFTSNFAPIPNLDREIRADLPMAYWPMTNPIDDGYFNDPIYGARYIVPHAGMSYQNGQLGAGVEASAGYQPYGYANTSTNPLGLDFLQGDYTIEMVVSIPAELPATEGLFFLGATPGVTSPAADYALMALSIDVTTMKFQFRTGDNLASVVSHDLALQLGQVYHLAAIRTSSGSAYLFVNGLRPVNLGTGFAPTVGVGTNARVWTHVALTGPTNAQGYINMGYLALYNYALTPARIMAHAVNLARA